MSYPNRFYLSPIILALVFGVFFAITCSNADPSPVDTIGNGSAADNVRVLLACQMELN